MLAKLAKFGSVGALAYVVDLGVFNLIRLFTASSPLLAKIISVAIATLVAWLGNRYWTFSANRTSQQGTELAKYAVINIVGLVVALIPLWISHYLLGFTSLLADNIATNGVGLVLGTIFRYFCYQKWVFTGQSQFNDRGKAPTAAD